MAIDSNIRQEIENRTRRLGTKADTYLQNFCETFIENKEIKNLKEFYDLSTYMKDASVSKFKQFEEVLYIFRLIDIDKKIIIKELSSKEEYYEILSNNIKITLKGINNFIPIYDNTRKLVNDFIYNYGISILKDEKKNVSKIHDELMENRTKEMRVSKIKITGELKKLIIKEIKILFDECGLEINDKLLDEIETNSVPETIYSEKKVSDLKSQLNFGPINTFDIMEMVLDKEKKLLIPFYQREYVWSNDLIEGLLKSIAYNKREILNIGNILISIKGENNLVREYAIVDGQQRITSLILIMNYISKSLDSMELSTFNLEPALLNLINKCKSSEFIDYFFNDNNDKYIKLLNEVLDLPVNTPHKSRGKNNTITANYNATLLFIESLKTMENKINFLKKLAYVFSFVSYDSFSNEMELFISTNSSRKPLSNFDLIKAFIISCIPNKTEKKDKEKINAYIKEITELMKFGNKPSEKEEDIFFTLFLNYNDVHMFGEIRPIKNIFDTFRKTFENSLSESKDIITFLKSMKSKIKSYKYLKGIEKASDEFEHLYIKDFRLSLGTGLKVKSIYDIFMIYAIENSKAIEDIKTKVNLLNEFRKILLSLEKFDIKWKLFEFNGDSLAGSLNSLFVKFYYKVNEGIIDKSYKNIYKLFNELVNDEKENNFVCRLLKNENIEDIMQIRNCENLKNDKIALKILNRVAFNLYNNGINYKSTSKIYYNHSKPSIEHVYPQNDSLWRLEDEHNANELKNSLQEIGNKFIFNKDKNSSAGNKVFTEKIKIYKDYNEIKIDKTLEFKFNEFNFKLLEKNKWTKEDVELRSEYIITELLNIWK